MAGFLRISFILLVFASSFCLLPTVCVPSLYGATYVRTCLTGGAGDCLDAIPGASLLDRDVAQVLASGQLFIYVLDAGSGVAANPPLVVAPTTQAGTKRWVLQKARSRPTVADYGSDLRAAITAIGSVVTSLVVNEPLNLTTDLTVPSTLQLLFERPGSLAQGSAHHLVFGTPPVVQGNYRVFIGFAPGEVTGLKDPTPELFGVNSSPGATDMTTAVASAIASTSAGDILFEATNYAHSSAFSLGSNKHLRGKGAKSTTFTNMSRTAPAIVLPARSYNQAVTGIKLFSPTFSSAYAIDGSAGQVSELFLDDYEIERYAGGIIGASGSGFINSYIGKGRFIGYPDDVLNGSLTNPSDAGDTRGWSAGGATLSTPLSGRIKHCLQITNSRQAAGYAAQAVTTVAGERYTLTFWAKKGTRDGGKVYVGSRAGSNDFYESALITDAGWALYKVSFKATTATTYITLWCWDNHPGRTALFDEIVLRRDCVAINLPAGTTGTTVSGAYIACYTTGIDVAAIQTLLTRVIFEGCALAVNVSGGRATTFDNPYFTGNAQTIAASAAFSLNNPAVYDGGLNWQDNVFVDLGPVIENGFMSTYIAQKTQIRATTNAQTSIAPSKPTVVRFNALTFARPGYGMYEGGRLKATVYEWNDSTATFTASRPRGTYRVSTTVLWPGGCQYPVLSIYKNGAVYSSVSGGAATYSQTITDLVQLYRGDTIQIYVEHAGTRPSSLHGTENWSRTSFVTIDDVSP